MAFLILIAFIAIPLVEIAVFIKVGEQIGLWPTVGTVILTAVIGTALLRQQGIMVLFRIRENLEANRLPIAEMFDGLCLVVAGLLLLTPGFVTDTMGFLLMVPPLRRLIAAEVARRFIAKADIHVNGHPPGDPFDDPFGGAGPRAGSGSNAGPVIDGEFRDVTPGSSGDEDGKDKSRLPPNG